MANGGEVRSRGADNTKRQMLTGFGIAVGWAFTWTCAYFLAAVNDVGWVVAVWYIAQAPSTVLFYPLLFATSNGIVVVTAISTLQGLFVGALLSYLFTRLRARKSAPIATARP